MPRQRLSVAPIASTRSVGAVPAVGGGTYARGTCAAERSAIAIVISVRDDANGIRACDSRVMPCHVVDNDITPSLQWVTTSRQQAGGIRKGASSEYYEYSYRYEYRDFRLQIGTSAGGR